MLNAFLKRDCLHHCLILNLIQQEKEEQHQLAVTAFLKNSRKEHQRILARRQTIEERKERLESLNIQREKEELEQREAELQKVRKAEEERLRQEAKEREKERILQEHEQIKKKTVRERLEQIKKTELGAKAFKDIDIEVGDLLLQWGVTLLCVQCYIAGLPGFQGFVLQLVLQTVFLKNETMSVSKNSL